MTEIKKLEKKHLFAYLAHDVKAINEKTREVKTVSIGAFKDSEISYSWLLNDDYRKMSYRLLLRPMSDLYKEINGEVGINVIGKMFEPNGVLNFEDGNYYYGWNTHVCDDYQGYEIGWIDEVGWFGIFFDTYDYDNQTENFTGDYLPYNREVAEYLDENHFDWRYNLIDQGLAINKNDIE